MQLKSKLKRVGKKLVKRVGKKLAHATLAADASGLNSLTVVNAAQTAKDGYAFPNSIYNWSRGSDGSISDSPTITPITNNPWLPSSTLPKK